MIQTSSNVGIQTLNSDLTDLVKRNIISVATVRAAAKTPDNLPG